MTAQLILGPGLIGDDGTAIKNSLVLAAADRTGLDEDLVDLRGIWRVDLGRDVVGGEMVVARVNLL